MSERFFVRTCQECGNKQKGVRYSESSYCRKCKSDGLDFGSAGWLYSPDKGFYKPESEEDTNETGS